MDTHVKALGMANLIFGVCSLVLGLLALIIYGGPFGLYHSFMDYILGLLIVGFVLSHVLIGIPCIIGGIYLRSFTEWARGLVIVTSALNIFEPAGRIDPRLLTVCGYCSRPKPTRSFPLRRLITDPKTPAHAAPPAKESNRVAKPKATGATIVPSPRS